MAKQTAESIIGMTFNKLTVKQINTRGKYLADTRYFCECACGKKAFVTGRNLKSGHTKSCGCLRNNYVEHSESFGVSTLRIMDLQTI